MIAIIAALTKDRVIGANGTLPWNLPEDLQLFKRRTRGSTVVMGYRTYVSIGKPLPERTNIVLSDRPVEIPGVVVCSSFEEALAEARATGKDIYFIGGASVYAQALPLADTLYLSWVKQDYEGDTYFPDFDRDEWVEREREDHGAFEAVTYTRRP